MTTRKFIFRLHWIAGITAGLVLTVVGATGGLLAMEKPVLRWLNPQLTIVPLENAEAMTPDALVALAEQAAPGMLATSVSWHGADRAASVRLSARDRRDRRSVHLDPWTGTLLAPPRGEAFFHSVEGLHRRLAAGAAGKQIVGASTVLLLLLAISGLIQRWPRRHTLRLWLKPEWRLRGRGLWRNLHAVLGTWVLGFYLLAALTGLWWSYDTYRDAINSMAGISGSLRSPRPGLQEDMPHLSVDRAWHSFRAAVPDATAARLNLTTDPAGLVTIRYQTDSSPHERAWDTLQINPITGSIAKRQRYATQAAGRRFVASLFPLHSGSFFGPAGSALMALACLLMPFFTVSGFVLWYLRRQKYRLPRPAGLPAKAGQPHYPDSSRQTARSARWRPEPDAGAPTESGHPDDRLP